MKLMTTKTGLEVSKRLAVQPTFIKNLLRAREVGALISGSAHFLSGLLVDKILTSGELEKILNDFIIPIHIIDDGEGTELVLPIWSHFLEIIDFGIEYAEFVEEYEVANNLMLFRQKWLEE